MDDVYKEIEIMKKLDHPNIVTLYEIIDDPCSEKLYLVMPVADYGECIEWDPDFKHNKSPDSFDLEPKLPSASPSSSTNFDFHPNHRLQARNINKKKKARLEDAIFYDQE